MRKITAAALPALLVASLLASPVTASPVPHGKVCSQLVLTAHPAYPPVALAANGTLQGAGIDVVRRIAAANGIRVRVINEGSWDAAQGAVKSGKADAIVGLYLTRPRMQFFDYVQPAIAPDPSAVLVRKGTAFSYRNWNSLTGKRGAVSEGEQYGHAFDAFMDSKLTITRVKGFEGVYAALENRSADYGLAGYYSALTSAPRNIVIAEPNVVTEGLYIAFGKASPCASAIPQFSQGVKHLIKDGTVARLMQTELAAYRRTKR